jgi:hypothetical protein
MVGWPIVSNPITSLSFKRLASGRQREKALDTAEIIPLDNSPKSILGVLVSTSSLKGIIIDGLLVMSGWMQVALVLGRISGVGSTVFGSAMTGAGVKSGAVETGAMDSPGTVVTGGNVAGENVAVGSVTGDNVGVGSDMEDSVCSNRA